MKQQDLEALKLVSRFSLPPNALGYCGEASAPRILLECIKTGNCENVEHELSQFIVLNPYLETISKVTGESKFSYDVIEAYCIGNELLNNFELKHYELLLENFLKQGVPEWFVEELKETPPKEFLPNHLFQVLHVGVGRASGSVPYNNDTRNNCMIRWGKVQEISDGMAQVKVTGLSEEKTMCELNVEVQFSKDLTPNIERGRLVAVHWGQIILELSEDQESKICYWTKQILDRI